MPLVTLESAAIAALNAPIIQDTDTSAEDKYKRMISMVSVKHPLVLQGRIFKYALRFLIDFLVRFQEQRSVLLILPSKGIYLSFR